MNRALLAVCLVAAVAVVHAAKSDTRLATVRKAWVEAVDELGDDRAVAACVADRLHRDTPIEMAKDKAGADVILKVKAHITSGTSRVLLGSMGGSPSAHLYAEAPDGTKLWDATARRPACKAPASSARRKTTPRWPAVWRKASSARCATR